MSITANELILVSTGASLLGVAIGGGLSYLTQASSTKATLSAQRELAEQAREQDRADEIQRENRAHKRDAYMTIINKMSEVHVSLSFIAYLRSAPRMGNSDTTKWDEYTKTREHTVIEAKGLAITNGSDELISAIQDVADEFEVLFGQLQKDQDKANDQFETAGPNGTAPNRAATTLGLHDRFNVITRSVWTRALRVQNMARTELGLSATPRPTS